MAVRVTKPHQASGKPRRARTQESLGQLSLAWPEQPTPVSVPDPMAPAPAHAPAPPSPRPVPSPAPRKLRQRLQDIVEKYLRDHQIPYIRVDEAKKALFAGQKLRSMHFVVYRRDADNWLLWAAHMRKEARMDLREWEKVFGEGFKAVIARQKSDTELEFRSLKGQRLTLE